MRRAAALAAITMLACAGASGQTTGPDGSDPCTRLGDLAATMDCLAAVDTPRPYDGVERCAGLDPGQFKRPVQGKLILRYGEKTQFGSTSRGVVIETGPAGQVVAPIDSVVLYAGEFRSCGKLLILEPGCGLRVLIAGVDTTDGQRGQLVLSGESLATMASHGGLRCSCALHRTAPKRADGRSGSRHRRAVSAVLHAHPAWGEGWGGGHRPFAGGRELV